MKKINLLQNFLKKLLEQNFESRSLDWNKKLIEDIHTYSKMFDKNEAYELKAELYAVRIKLNRIVYGQLQKIDISRLNIHELILHYKKYDVCIFFNYNVPGDSIDEPIRAAQLMIRQHVLARARTEESKDKKINLLNFVVANSKLSSKEHSEADRMLEEYGQSEEQVHFQLFGEGPK